MPWEELNDSLVAGGHRHHRDRRHAAHPDEARRSSGHPRPRRNRPLFIIDIALPRDVEPAVGELEQVFLYNIDDLQATVRENLARRASEVARAEAIVADEVEKFGAWFRPRGAIPTVVALRQRFEAIRRAELERLELKLAGAAARGADARRRDHAPASSRSC